MLQAVRRMDEVELRIVATVHVFGVAVADVPGAHAGHERKQFEILGQRVGTCTDVDSFSDEVANDEIGIVQPPLNRFAEFMHAG